MVWVNVPLPKERTLFLRCQLRGHDPRSGSERRTWRWGRGRRWSSGGGPAGGRAAVDGERVAVLVPDGRGPASRRCSGLGATAGPHVSPLECSLVTNRYIVNLKVRGTEMAFATSDASDLDTSALDAYSQAVTRVAADLTPRVAALEVFHRRPDGRLAGGAGSGLLFSPTTGSLC